MSTTRLHAIHDAAQAAGPTSRSCPGCESNVSPRKQMHPRVIESEAGFTVLYFCGRCSKEFDQAANFLRRLTGSHSALEHATPEGSA